MNPRAAAAIVISFLIGVGGLTAFFYFLGHPQQAGNPTRVNCQRLVVEGVECISCEGVGLSCNWDKP